ncbi:MAG: serine/threonine protein kinase [Myxococcota bacterium]|nr:serine/threonine protein kinase [Myxococcota bacterium]
MAELARGGMGNVYLVVAQGPGGFNKLLAMKELKPELSDDPTYVSMFLDEARLAARLNHPNIVQTNEVGSEGSRHYMTMEFLDGRSLHRIRRRFVDQGCFPVGAHLRIVAESLLGLHYAHDLVGFDGEPLGIVHRDVSPLNVFVTFDGQAKVLDFGIAKTIDSSQETKAGVLKGRVAYMAPEQACGAKVDRRADIYSAGVMIWEAAAGRRLWPGMSEVEILSRLLREGAPALRTVCPDAPQQLEVICSRAMAAQPEDRYATAAALHDDLEAHIAERDDAMSMRQLGAIIGRTFAEERRQMNAVIEEALARARGTIRSGVVPVMPLLQRPISGSFSARVAPGSSNPPSHRPTSGHRGNPEMVSEIPLASATSVSPSSIERSRAGLWDRLGLPMSMLCAGAAVGSVIAFAIVRQLGARSQAAAAQPMAIVAPAPTVSATLPELVDITVRVTPPSSQIKVDGTSVANNPFRGRFPKDNHIHHVAATADGYEPKLEDVVFSGDVSIDVSLDRRAPLPPRKVLVQPR